MKYYLMEPSEEDNIKEFDFSKMNKKQAQKYFDWYMSQIPKRISIIEEYFKFNEDIKLDYTVKSLVPLWKAFEENIKIRPKEEQLELEKMFPEGTYATFTSKTLGLARDISMYFGEVFRLNNNGIYWGHFNKPSKRDGLNKPTLLGLKLNLDLEPFSIICIGCWKSLDKKNPDFLLEVFNTWLEYVPEISDNTIEK